MLSASWRTLALRRAADALVAEIAVVLRSATRRTSSRLSACSGAPRWTGSALAGAVRSWTTFSMPRGRAQQRYSRRAWCHPWRHSVQSRLPRLRAQCHPPSLRVQCHPPSLRCTATGPCPCRGPRSLQQPQWTSWRHGLEWTKLGRSGRMRVCRLGRIAVATRSVAIQVPLAS